MILVHDIEEIVWDKTKGPDAGSNNWEFIVHVKGHQLSDVRGQVPDQDVQMWVNEVLGRGLKNESGVSGERSDLIENSTVLDQKFRSELAKLLYEQ